MVAQGNAFTPYSTLRRLDKVTAPSWVPEDDQERIGAYTKYEEIYWNDSRQFSLRVLEDEEPVYIPNARTIVDTTSYYLLKGLTISVDGEKNVKLKKALDDFLKREEFYPRFHTAKHRGVAIGDFVLHLTANPNKPEGSRLSLVSVDPSIVFPIYDEDVPDKMIGCHLAEAFVWEDPNTGEKKERVRKLTYRLVEQIDGTRRVSREEGIYEMTPKWWGPKPELVRTTIPKALLPEEITALPIYWFRNISWDGWDFGSSELKGFETILRAISQGVTDTTSALSLEGLGVFATDGGRPVKDDGTETDWEISPGKVMEVPTGSYFRRVEGVSSITPMTDHTSYLESKLREAGGLSDVALGRVDVQTAQSGIALAIKFIPTLAKIEERDQAGIARLTQLFHDWKNWHLAYEEEDLGDDEILVEIGDKLPEDRTSTINELNNMLDRQIISRKYYRQQMQKLGYEFPTDMDDEIAAEKKADAELAAATAPPPLAANAVQAVNGQKPPPANGGVAEKANQSNNANRVNESNGTEAQQ